MRYDPAQAAHVRAESRMRRFDLLPPEWRRAARRNPTSRLEYKFAQKISLADALRDVRLDPETLTDAHR